MSAAGHGADARAACGTARFVKLVCALMLLPLLGGCWNSKDIQTIAYVTAIGLDYADGKYIAYVQVLNFSNLAKSETTELGKNIPVWIGKGEGVTVTESFNKIYSTSQLRLFWGHVKAIVCSENYLKQGALVKEAYDMLNRYREIRYNILMYGTREPIRDIFVQKSLLNLSPLDTLMDTPTQAYSQRSFILPEYGFKVIAEYNEPAEAAMLPSLSLDHNGWTEDYKAKQMFRIDGAYFFRGQSMNGWLSEKDLQGTRWLQKKLQRSPINVPDDKNPAAALVMIKPKPVITTEFSNNKTYYNISVSIESYLDEMARNVSKEELERMAAEVIEKQIRDTYAKGLEIKIDVYKLGEQLYRKDPAKWKEQHGDGEFTLTEDSLKDVRVNVRMLHSGKYKTRFD
ncbi:Ger(x)C family spore germination protein [Paenibacillus hodogayensis]|uniref:Ger(X)C family spore germination protein n=1 Tax=Paenibacillus hodogayensis TaxID=279208 RepID=A0ABV5VZL1_9BACL